MTKRNASVFHRHLNKGTALALVTLFGGIGLGQTASAQDAAAAPAATDGDAVVVVGTRASQRSSIDRKKRAKTATDSIVAEDVGKFPDRNIGEAISRIAGVALDRGDYGEGIEVTVRGATSAQTNVEIDGLGVQNTTTTNNLAFGGGGRGKEFREFPADLIKSVDVVKGTTAAMTEGSLGGSILIQSRTSLDFKKPFVSFRFDVGQNSLSEKWQPSFNFIATRKFFNDRLGILVNYTDTRLLNDNNAVQNATSGNQGLARGWNPPGTSSANGTAAFDLDGSAEKTFTYNPATLSTTDSGATTAFGNGSLETPMSLLTKSAGAQTKADCYTLFPEVTGSTANNLQRTRELMTCLNQWSDYMPSLVRYFVRRNEEHRQTLDVRLDYRVTDDLRIFAKVNMNKRENQDHQLTYSLGNVNVNPMFSATSPLSGGVITPTYNGIAFTDVAGVRQAAPGSGYFLYDGISQVMTSNANGGMVRGAVANIDRSTLKVDKNHHVTEMTLTDATVGTDQIRNTNDITSSYLSAGANYKGENLTVDLIMGYAESDYTRYDYRSSFSYTYGRATMAVDPTSGLWGYTTPAGFDQADASLYAQVRYPAIGTGSVAAGPNGPAVPAYSRDQLPWVNGGMGLQISPKATEDNTSTLRIDINYDVEDELPFLTNISTGINARKFASKGWGGGGRQIAAAQGTFGTPGYVAPVVLPTANLRGTFRACEEVYGSGATAAPAGSLACNYGYVPQTTLSNVNYGTFTVHQADFDSILQSAIEPMWNQFFNGAPDRGNLIEGWSQLNLDTLYSQISEASKDPRYSAGGDPLKNYNFDCLKRCKANDGKEYDMPFSTVNEETKALYLMAEFEQELPWNMLFNGNVGVRYVETNLNGTGFVTLRSIRCNNPANCTGATPAAQTTTLDFVKDVTFQGTTKDWTQHYNYNLWMIPDQLVFRFNADRVVARPPISALLPAGTCTFDQRFDGGISGDGTETDKTCGNFGNPNLKPLKSTNQNYSLEWYPNRDTQFSYSVFKNNIKIGDPRLLSRTNVKLFDGYTITDPATGEDVSDEEYSYNEWSEGLAFIRRGQEFAVKSAFTFLPWHFKHLGFDGNYAKINSSNTAAGIRDPNSGDVMRPANEPSFYFNASLWYDDGITNARLSVQSRSDVFSCIASCGANTGNNYLGEGYTNVRLPYSPGAANFRSETQYVDFKISHKATENVELFFQANNVMEEFTESTQGEYNAYADGTPSVLERGYAGYRVSTGFTLRY
ncbi:tonB-dependent receptor family protein [Asticcacaulis biprosthecium C19]|uniref:TonB-dependent receptor family protein n=1 Tax=Asticcacaulis biprosthecium C19 TaxID=715226 RepID=F4QH68_9CAUL|nr:TonB-dependent receptor [Asticcacaulis biprosthecium]EGF92605.1 tonB-dependent receptor family protein [Asticcacaulis biprosthecium C19]